MPANLDDILTTQKNGVVAINGINQALSSLLAFESGSALPAGTAPTGTYGTLYTVPTGRQATITDIEICNTGTVAATFNISLCSSGQTAGASNALFYNAQIPPGTTVQWTGKQTLSAGGFVAAYASVSAVTFKINGGVI